ncbi:MAG: NAD(P)-dependent alcohol dehydrogenase [bacterium]|nr:NAD(P)-dependent alcohol dehydrogenase [bacterium]
MKAVLGTKYGAPEVLQIGELEKPTPKDNEVLIRVHAAVVGPSDTAFRQGKMFIIKLIYGFGKPRNPSQGVELSGKIEAIGKDVTLFKVGDEVMGMDPNKFGAHAEYICLPEHKTVVVKSPNMSYEEAVGLCDGGLTALIFLRDVAKIQKGQRILINGASGAVGSAAVQLAKYYGAEVTGVCSSANVALVKSLGADMVIDYTKADFTKSGQTYDVVFDAVGKSSFGKCKRILTPKGAYMTTVPSLTILRNIVGNMFRSKKAKFTTAGLKQTKNNLNFIVELFDAGKIRAVIDRRYPLEQIVEAHRYVDTGRKKGNVVITVA